MVIKFSIHMSNRYKLKVTKFQSFIYFIKKVIIKKPLGGGAESAPPQVLIGLRESQPSYKLSLVIAYLTWLFPVDEKTGCANLTRS